jgi:hypothetical protein
MSVWEILTSENYDAWFQEQTEEAQTVIFSKVYLLREQGPNLGRPHADTLKGSKKLSNLKELRAKTDAHVFRIAYIFDPQRKCLLLIGGDKKGKNQKRFYTDLISQAETIYTAYLKKKKQKRRRNNMEFHPLSELEAKTSSTVLAKARKLYEQESLSLKLKALRGKYGVKQADVSNFTQTAVSKLEHRKDLKISTLIDYLESLGLGLEIVALSKDNDSKREILLRI